MGGESGSDRGDATDQDQTAETGDMEVVSEGLKAGETVVTDGQLMLHPGAQIVTREQMQKMKGKTPVLRRIRKTAARQRARANSESHECSRNCSYDVLS